MNERAEIITKILDAIIKSGDVDGGILRLNEVINLVSSQTDLPQHEVCQVALPQEP